MDIRSVVDADRIVPRFAQIDDAQRFEGTEQSSLEALRKASATSYYKGKGSLWVKLVSTGDILGSGPGSGPGAGVSLQASR